MIRNDFGHVLISWWVTLFAKVSLCGQNLETNFSSINLDSRWILFLHLSNESYIMKMHFSWCITILVYTAQSRKFEKFINIHLNTNSLGRTSLTPPEVFCKDFIDISYENGSFCILEDSATYLSLNYNCILVWEISFSDRWEHSKLTTSEC